MIAQKTKPRAIHKPLGHLSHFIFISFVLVFLSFSVDARSFDKEKIEKEFKDKCGDDLTISWDEKRDAPKYILGSHCDFGTGKKKISKNSETIKNSFGSIVKSLETTLEVPVDDLKPLRVEQGTYDWLVEYQQYFLDVPVEDAVVGMTLSDYGDLVSLSSEYRPDVHVSTTPVITIDAAQEIVEEKFKFAEINSTNEFNVTITKEINVSLVILPINDSYELVWKVRVYSSPAPLIHAVVYVSATNGEIVKETDLVLDNFRIYGNMYGQVYPSRPTDSPQTVLLSNLIGYAQVLDYDTVYSSLIAYSPILNGNSYDSTWLADDCAYMYDLGSCADTFAAAQLLGAYVKVINDAGSSYWGTSSYWPNFAGNAQTNIMFQANDETNCYYHTNYVHAFFRNSPFNFNGMSSYTVECHVNAIDPYTGSPYNGAANGYHIYFGSDHGLQWVREANIIYHEYAHNVIFHLYGNQFIGQNYVQNSEARAMDEGLADYFGISIAGNPLAVTAPYYRDLSLDWNRNYDYDYSSSADPHKNGMIIASTLWDVRNSIGIARTDSLVFESMRDAARPHSFSEMFKQILIKDDTNGYVRDGTMYGAEILSAFKQHGMDYNQGPFAVVNGVSATPMISDDVILDCLGVDTNCKPTRKYYFDADGVCSSSVSDYIYSTTSGAVTVSTPHSDYICLLVEDYLGDTHIIASSKLNVVGSACTLNSQCGTNGFTGSLMCSGNTVVQNYITWTCNNPGTASASCSSSNAVQSKQVCSDFCSSGACVTATCKTASDCGANGFTGSLMCSGKDVVQNYRTWSCANPNTASATCVSSDVPQTKQVCSDFCSSGACGVASCTSDSQCGTNGYTGSLMCSGKDVVQNYKTWKCNNPGTASASCSSSDVVQTKQTCSEVCSGGSCVAALCSSDSQCGTNGFIGAPVCAGKDVNQSYRTWKCNNPGTSSAVCSSTDAPKQKQVCTDFCSNGACVTAVCNTNTDCGTNGFSGAPYCNGNKVMGFNNTYTCINPGTASAACVTVPAIQQKEVCSDFCSSGACGTAVCKTASDCGTNGLTGALSCSGNNVLATNRTFICNNPGTATASCSHTDTTPVKEICSDGCSAGSCICKPVYSCTAWSPAICPIAINGIYFTEQARTCTDTKCGTGSITEKRSC